MFWRLCHWEWICFCISAGNTAEFWLKVPYAAWSASLKTELWAWEFFWVDAEKFMLVKPLIRCLPSLEAHLALYSAWAQSDFKVEMLFLGGNRQLQKTPKCHKCMTAGQDLGSAAMKTVQQMHILLLHVKSKEHLENGWQTSANSWQTPYWSIKKCLNNFTKREIVSRSLYRLKDPLKSRRIIISPMHHQYCSHGVIQVSGMLLFIPKFSSKWQH